MSRPFCLCTRKMCWTMIDRDKTIGLYDPRYEHDSCGVGFVCDVKGRRSNKIVSDGIGVLRRLAHRGAVGADPETGDGAADLSRSPTSS